VNGGFEDIDMDDQQEHIKVLKKELSQMDLSVNKNIGYE
jgi:hypothetical protein